MTDSVRLKHLRGKYSAIFPHQRPQGDARLLRDVLNAGFNTMTEPCLEYTTEHLCQHCGEATPDFRWESVQTERGSDRFLIAPEWGSRCPLCYEVETDSDGETEFVRRCEACEEIIEDGKEMMHHDGRCSDWEAA